MWEYFCLLNIVQRTALLLGRTFPGAAHSHHIPPQGCSFSRKQNRPGISAAEQDPPISTPSAFCQLPRSSEAVSELTASARGRLLKGLPSSAPRDADSSIPRRSAPLPLPAFLAAPFCRASAWEGLKLLNPDAWNQRACDLTCTTRSQAVKCLASTVSFACECCAWRVQKGLSEPWGRAVVWLMTLSSLPFHSGDEHIGNALINVDYRIKSSSPFKSGL